PADGTGPGTRHGAGRGPVPGTAARAVRPRRTLLRPGRRDPRGGVASWRVRAARGADMRLGTRGSALAMAQSGLVAQAIRDRAGRSVELVEIVTAGDRSTAPVARLGVGVFVSALRDALLAKEIDVAVHSYKDLPTAAADGLVVAAVPTREDPRDALVASGGRTLTELAAGARIGTGSIRRIAQLEALG